MNEASRSIIVTGGTGALGRALVGSFLDHGDRVVVPWLVPEERDHASGIWKGRAVELIEADIAEDAGARRVAAAAGSPDVLVNGAGGFAFGGPLQDTPLDTWDQMYRINVRTAVAMSRAVLPGMLERGSGSIVNICSQAAADAPPEISAYSASKSAVAVLTRSLDHEGAARGLRANAVVPTTIDTPANRASMPDADHASWTRPEQIAQVILWLASDAAGAVRGALIPV
ncbi:MAG: SDR family NAD(P)-dependent oxidoreductase [Deltaproteobacteria bacterium]|nr:SDR family NAD(P)-dependent oxidoreductase [Deltaproteobacteria bacterium]